MVGYKPDAPVQVVLRRTQAEAKKEFATFQAQRSVGIILKARTLTLGESENTYQQYKYGLSKSKALYKRRLDKLTALHTDQIYTHMLKDGLSPRSVQVAHLSLYGALKQAVVWEMIDVT